MSSGRNPTDLFIDQLPHLFGDALETPRIGPHGPRRAGV